ncbi:MAG: vWA domain-containing protein [Planctomycetota bacterium]
MIAPVADGHAVGDSNTVFIDLMLVDVDDEASFTIDCPTTASVSIERAPTSWASTGTSLLSAGTWSGSAVTFEGWQASISVAGTEATITVSQVTTSPTSDMVRVRVSELDAAACTATEGGNATIERVLADPSLTGLGSSGPPREKSTVTLLGTVDYTQFTTGSASLSALPPIGANWLRDPSDPLAFSLGATTFAGVGGAPAQADFVVPGLYADVDTAFELRGYCDLDASGTYDLGEPENSEPFSLEVSPTDFHILLVIDRSGSMSGSLPGVTPGGSTKWEEAKAAAHLWTDFMLAFRSGDGHRMGIVTFEHGTCGWGTQSASGEVDLRIPPPGALAPLSTFDLDALDLGEPASCTPIGESLVFAMDKLLAESPNQDERRVIVLLTDGYQNSGTVTIKSTPPASGVTTWASERTQGARQIISNNLDLYTIAVGQETEEDLLNDLPNDPVGGAGFYHLTNDSSDLLETYAAMLGNSLDAESLSPTNTPAETDPGSATETADAKYVQVNQGETRLAVAMVRSDSSFKARLAYRDQGSSGPFTPIGSGPDVVIHERLRHTMAIINLSGLFADPAEPAKEWRLQLRTDSGTSQILDGKVVAMVDLHVKAQVSFDRSSYRTGEPIQLQCSLSAGARPLPDAEVTVEVAAPGEGLGTFLATNSGRYKPVDQDGDVKPPKQLMFSTLLKSLQLPGLAVVNPVFADGTNRLHDDGAHGDGAADDGVYANSIAATDKEGTYRFRIRVRGEVSPNNRFDRLFVRSTWVGVRTDVAASPVTMVTLPAPGPGLVAIQVLVTPKSATGELVGPFRADEVTFQSSAGSWQGQVESRLDGSYSYVLHYPEGQQPVVQVTVGDQPLGPLVVGGEDSGDLCDRHGCIGLFFVAIRCLFRKLLRGK